MSTRDKFILLFLLVGAIGGAIYYFGYRYLREEISVMTAERNTLRGQSDEHRMLLEAYANTTAQIPLVESAIESIADMYTSAVYQSYYLLLLLNLFEESNITLDRMTHTLPRGLPFNRAQLEQATNMGMDIAVMGYTRYQLIFSCTRDELLNLLRLIEDRGRGFTSSDITISVLSSEEPDEPDLLNVQFVLMFFYVDGLGQFSFDHDFRETFDRTVFMEDRAALFNLD